MKTEQLFITHLDGQSDTILLLFRVFIIVLFIVVLSATKETDKKINNF